MSKLFASALSACSTTPLASLILPVSRVVIISYRWTSTNQYHPTPYWIILCIPHHIILTTRLATYPELCTFWPCLSWPRGQTLGALRQRQWYPANTWEPHHISVHPEPTECIKGRSRAVGGGGKGEGNVSREVSGMYANREDRQRLKRIHSLTQTEEIVAVYGSKR